MAWYRLLTGIIALLMLPIGPNASLFSQSCDSIPILKIGLVADPQYADRNPADGRYYRETLKRLPQAVDTFNKRQVDFVVTLGDLVDGGEHTYDSIVRFYRNLNMPYYHVLGNHEFYDISNDYMSTLLQRYEMPGYYYDFSYKNWRFLVLDGTELAEYSRYLHPELAAEGDSLFASVYGQVNGFDYNGGISRKQQQWMREKITEAMNEEQNVVLFCHFPVYPETLYATLWNSQAIIDLLDEYPNVTAYINGHYHEGGYSVRNGIHYFTENAIVNTPDKNSFAILEIFSDEIRLKGYGIIADRVLSYENIKKKPLNFSLTDSVIHYSDHTNSYLGKFISNGEIGTEHILFELLSQKYQGESFTIRHDSLFLNSEEDLSVADDLQIEVKASGCEIDETSRVFHLPFDTSAARFNFDLHDTLLSVYNSYPIRFDSLITDYSRTGLSKACLLEYPGVLNASLTDSELILVPIKVGNSNVEVSFTDPFTGKSYLQRFHITTFDPLNHPPEVNLTTPKKCYVLLNDTLKLGLNSFFTDADLDNLVFGYSVADLSGFTFHLEDSILSVTADNPAATSCEITANDLRGGTATTTIELSVNRRPQKAYTTSHFLFQFSGSCQSVHFDTMYFDPDDDTLLYTVLYSDFSFHMVNDSLIHLCPEQSGHGIVELSIHDTKNGILFDTLQIRFNAHPEALNASYQVAFKQVNQSVEIDLDTIFFDNDGDALCYALQPGSASNVSSISGSMLHITPADTLPLSLTLLADDSFGGTDSAEIGLFFSGTPTSINPSGIQPKVTIYPNPSDGEVIITITPPLQGEITLDIYTLEGIRRYRKEINLTDSASESIHCVLNTTIPDGTFILHLILPDGSVLNNILEIRRNSG
jgi:manganese-dependent ADP-ribose/CDP-alcohol diphosphatase